ncbi:MAG: hypothetical protein ACHQNE_10370, partial [Candidatus Kapaibacterium sp.]
MRKDSFLRESNSYASLNYKSVANMREHCKMANPAQFRTLLRFVLNSGLQNGNVFMGLGRIAETCSRDLQVTVNICRE